MDQIRRIGALLYFVCLSWWFCSDVQGQDLPARYPMLELFTNTPCPICANQNPGLFNRLANFEGQYHLVSFYPGRPYSSCIFYQANIPENTSRWQFYTGHVFGTPTVAINGTDFKNSNGVTLAVLQDITGGESWLEMKVEESAGASRTVHITMRDHVGGSLTTGLLFAVIVEKVIQYNAPNGETIHHNVFRRFLTATGGDEVNLGGGLVVASFDYEVDASWQENQVYVIAWLMDPVSEEIINSGTRFDPAFTTSVNNPADAKLHIFPNPSTGNFNIQLPERQNTTWVKVYSAAGALIFSRNYHEVSDISMDSRSWPDGNYLVQVSMGTDEWSKWVFIGN